MITTTNLVHGQIDHIGGGWEVAVRFLSNPEIDGKRLCVELLVVTPDGQEQIITLHPGDRFPIGPHTWQVTGIEGLGSYDYVVRIAMVDGSGIDRSGL